MNTLEVFFASAPCDAAHDLASTPSTYTFSFLPSYTPATWCHSLALRPYTLLVSGAQVYVLPLLTKKTRGYALPELIAPMSNPHASLPGAPFTAIGPPVFACHVLPPECTHAATVT